jgi:hypothetical protein
MGDDKKFGNERREIATKRDNENHLKNSSTVETVCSSYSVQFS